MTVTYSPAQIAVAKRMHDFFKPLGYTEIHCAALEGNSTGEDGLNRLLVGDGGKAFSFDQWHWDMRGVRIQHFTGIDIRNCSEDDAFKAMRWEMESPDSWLFRAGKNFKATTNLTDAITVLVHQVEMSANQASDIAKRVTYATAWLDYSATHWQGMEAVEAGGAAPPIIASATQLAHLSTITPPSIISPELAKKAQAVAAGLGPTDAAKNKIEAGVIPTLLSPSDKGFVSRIEKAGGVPVIWSECPHYSTPVNWESEPAGGLHTTEGSTEDGALGVFHQHYAPHFVVGKNAHDGKVEIMQLVPVGLIGAALRHNNDLLRVQIEVVSFSKQTPWIFDDETLAQLAALMKVCRDLWGIPLSRPWPDGDYGLAGKTAHRNSGKLGKIAGWYGHGDIPSPDDHWDPGNLIWAKVFEKAEVAVG